MKKLDNFLSMKVEKRLNRALKSFMNPCKADRIVKKSSFHLVEVEWIFKNNNNNYN